MGQKGIELARSRRVWHRRRRDVAVAVGVMVAVALMAQIPLLANHWFYYWDDTANTWMPTWYMLGQQLAAGHWPTLIPGLWRGGTWPPRCRTASGTRSSWATRFLLQDGQLAVAAAIVKTQLLTLLALGAYLAAREYGARRAAAAAVAIALPFAGFTLYADSTAWLDCLLGITGAVHVLWSVRRCGRGLLNPLVPIIIGYLALTTGSPYGALGTGVALVAVAAERAAGRDWRGLGVSR